MEIFTFYSPDYKKNIIHKDFFLLYTPFKMKYDHFYIGYTTPVESSYDLVITQDKVKIKSCKVVICEFKDIKSVVERSINIYKQYNKCTFVFNMNKNKIWCDKEDAYNNCCNIFDELDILDYPTKERKTFDPPNESTLSEFINTKIEEIKSDDTHVEDILRKLRAIHTINKN